MVRLAGPLTFELVGSGLGGFMRGTERRQGEWRPRDDRRPTSGEVVS